MSQPGQYLEKDNLLNDIPRYKINPNQLGSSDSYHENNILKKYLSINKDGQKLIYQCALQLAVIGYGNKNFGFIRDDDDKIIQLVDIFSKYNIKYLEKLNAKYADDELSVRRLLRLFRFQIQDFIIINQRPSYLWNKYANKLNKEFISICFPGGEHLVNKKEEAIFLLETYGNLDKQFGTKFRDRLKRVFIARGILPPDYFINVDY